MENTHSDLFIIGGGINGVGIAADAAGRGLAVTLCEKGDLAAGTSSTSSKLIHGGLRYLASYNFHLVRKALQERKVILRNAPHIVSPLEFILPCSKQTRPAWLIRIGLFIYDHLASHLPLPASKKINLAADPRGIPLQPELKTGFSYYDCFDDDARLVVLNAIVARDHGATILTRTECIAADYENQQWKIQLKDLATAKISTCYAKVLVNAAGPWIKRVQENIIHVNNPFSIELIKGTHIVVPKLYTGDFAYILQNSDERVVFVIPYENDFTLIGTTDVHYTGDLDQVRSSPEEEKYLCDTVNSYFKKSISPTDSVWSYAGVRCLQTGKKRNAAEISRDYKFELLDKTPLLTVISGKITTYRCLAEEAVNKLQKFFPEMKPAWTCASYLPGGDIPKNDFEYFYTEVCEAYPWLPKNIAYRYARSYGTLVYTLLQNTHSLADLGVEFAAGLYQREVDYLLQQEWAQTCEDILWRRTKLGLFFTPEDVKKLRNSIPSPLPLWERSARSDG